jgi:hypothetical protein
MVSQLKKGSSAGKVHREQSIGLRESKLLVETNVLFYKVCPKLTCHLVINLKQHGLFRFLLGTKLNSASD